MSHIVFLDFDGVILPIGACTDVEVGLVRTSPLAHVELVASRVSREAVEAVKSLKGAQIVVISSWRLAFTPNFILEFLTRIGLNEQLHEDWFAPCRRFEVRKAMEIVEWLDEHPGVMAAVMIDDQPVNLPRPLVQIIPDGRVGLKAEHLLALDAGFFEKATEVAS